MIMFTPEAISELRGALGLTVSEFAERLGVHRQTVYSWEKGETHPRYTDQLKLNALAKRARRTVTA